MQEDAQMAQLGKILRARPDLQSDPASIQRYNKYMTSRGLPSAVKTDPMTGRQYVDPDSIPNSGGIMDLTPQEKAYALSLPPAQRRIEFPGQTDAFYDQPMVLGAPERSKVMDDFSKNVTLAASGKLSPEGFASWLSSPDVRSVLGDGAAQVMVKNLNDPQWVAANIAPEAQAKIALLNQTGLTDAAKRNLYNIETQLKPQQLAAQIEHWHDQDSLGVARLGAQVAQNSVKNTMEQQRITNQAIVDNANIDKAQAQIREANANADKAISLVGSGNPAQAAAMAGILGRQMTALNSQMKTISSRMNTISTKTNPTPEEAAQLDPSKPGSLMAQYVQLSQDMQGLQSKTGQLYESITGGANNQASSMSGKAVTGLGAAMLQLPPGITVVGPPQAGSDGQMYYPLSNGKFKAAPF